MGLSLRFYAGDPIKIITAAEEADFDYLESLEGTEAYAEFDLHLQPKDLGYLSEAFGQILGVMPVILRDCLIFEEPVSDSEDGGAYRIDKKWGSFVAAFPEEKAEEATLEWVKIMNQNYPDEDITVNSDMVDAVRRLLATCKHSKAQSKELVHVWFA